MVAPALVCRASLNESRHHFKDLICPPSFFFHKIITMLFQKDEVKLFLGMIPVTSILRFCLLIYGIDFITLS